MKKTIFSTAFIFLTMCAFCQENNQGLKKESLFISGLLNYKYDNYKFSDTKSKSFDFAVSSGYMVTDKIAFGVLAAYKSIKRDVNKENVSDESIYSGGLFAKYFYTPNNKFTFFNDLSAVYGHAVENKTSKNIDGIGGALSLGVVYWLGNHFGLQASYAGLTYTSASVDNYDSAASEGFSVGGDLTNLKIGGVFKF